MAEIESTPTRIFTVRLLASPRGGTGSEVSLSCDFYEHGMRGRVWGRLTMQRPDLPANAKKDSVFDVWAVRYGHSLFAVSVVV